MYVEMIASKCDNMTISIYAFENMLQIDELVCLQAYMAACFKVYMIVCFKYIWLHVQL
jgi:hypothetical protein